MLGILCFFQKSNTSPIELPKIDDNLSLWIDRLSGFIPIEQLKLAESKTQGNVHKLLWYALKQYPIVHRNTLSSSNLQAFKELNSDDKIVSINQIINQVKQQFLKISIPHPDRDSRKNYLSYYPEDEESLENFRDCQDSAEARAKELLLREFALPFNRRSTLEAYALFGCHLESRDDRLIEWVAREFGISNTEAKIFLIVLTDIIRRTGIVSMVVGDRPNSILFPKI